MFNLKFIIILFNVIMIILSLFILFKFTDKFTDFDIFKSNSKLEFENHLKNKQYIDLRDNLSSELSISDDDGLNTYLENTYEELLNKNIDLQEKIENNTIKLNNTLQAKLRDLELINLDKSSKLYFSRN